MNGLYSSTTVETTATYKILKVHFPEITFWYYRGRNYKLRLDFQEEENIMSTVHGKTLHYKLIF